MTYVPPNPHGPAHAWLNSVAPETVTEAQFRAALVNCVEHGVADGVRPNQYMDVDDYFKPGDLQFYENIRSMWSPVPNARTCPTLANMQTGIRIIGQPSSFRETLDFMYGQFRKWCVNAGLDPDNLNETSVERNRRLSRERMRRKRAKDAESDITDPGEMDLVRAVRAAKENLKAGQSWFKGVEADAKTAYDAAVEAAKLARLQTVSNARPHIHAAEEAVRNAQAALDNYRINK